MLKEAIVLAGGKGTRLQSVVQNLPKPMAPVAGVPFLDYIFLWLEKHHFERVILSVGYEKDQIIQHYSNKFNQLDIVYSQEDSPLGTGGALAQALNQVTDDYVLILNGDTFFNIDPVELFENHLASQSQLTLALKTMHNFSRYGVVETDEDGRVLQFLEKQPREIGNINGGIYLANASLFETFDMPQAFSFETDFLEPFLDDLSVFAFECEGYFIDIGIPEDYQKAQNEIPALF